ncbi:MAG: arginine--tRNA ligase [Candidatus Omnitrophica bacterium]|nr:arginine--tRNA ligase [Candidatus Omnitrophota bacterium]MCM8809478.1 arginine--tRNA ligase [Candidatus Omnitrophota bacterium]MCM8810834.1 arginine--tRNA ligase [Candidatus Omnitrophota bacterium]
MRSDVKDKIEKTLKKIIKDFKKDVDFVVLPSEKEEFGDFYTNISFKLADKENPPQKLAEIIKQKISSDLKGIIKKIETKNGFINFFIDEDIYRENILKIFQNGKEYLKENIGNGKKILIEFVSANPTGPLTIAHGRQAAYGESLSRILKFSNFDVTKEYYINDAGRQMELLGESLKARYYQLKGIEYEIPEDGYFGDYLIDIAKKIKEVKDDKNFFIEFAFNEILQDIKKDLKSFGVSFDNWVKESEFIKNKEVENVLNILKNKNLIYEKEGSLWFKTTVFGDDKDRVVVKKDKTYTYLATDIAYHKYKIERNFEVIINIVGPDHHGYIPRLKASVTSLGFNPNNFIVLIVQLTTLYRGKEKLRMSTRKGQFITLRQLIDEIGADATKFFFLFRKIDSHLDFDIEVAKKQSSENPVYYLQYAYVRLKHVIEFAKEKGYEFEGEQFQIDLLNNEEEIELMKRIWKFNEIINNVVKTYGVHLLAEYLLDISKLFHSYYQKYRIVGDEKELTYARLVLIKSLLVVFELSLNLLNISLPERM